MSVNRLSESRARTIAWSAALALGVLTLASCGQPGQQAADSPSQPTSTVERSPNSASTTTDVPSLATPGAVVLDEDLYVNQNRPDSPLGTLCWSRREVVLSIVKLMQPERTEDAVPLDGRPLPEVIADVTDRIASSQISEDPQAGVFAAHFLSSLDGAASNEAQAIQSGDPDSMAKVWSEYFAFEGYPGIKEYLDVASASLDCPQP